MTDFLLFVAALVLASLLRGRSKPSFIWVIAAILVAVAGQAFAQLQYGGGFLSGLLGSFLGLFGSPDAAAKVILLVLALIVAFDVITDQKLDTKGAAALFLIPMVVLLTSGPLAAVFSDAYAALRGGVVSAIGAI